MDIDIDIDIIYIYICAEARCATSLLRVEIDRLAECC